MSSPFDSLDTFDEQAMRELSERGSRYYKEHLQATLEPAQNGKGIAVNPDTGAYVVADSPTLASRAMRGKYPGGGFVIMKIGPEPDYALAGRLLAGMQQREYEERKKMATIEQPVQNLFANKDAIRKIVKEQNEKMGFVPDSTATAQRGRERMRELGIRAENNLFSRGIIAARDEEPLF